MKKFAKSLKAQKERMQIILNKLDSIYPDVKIQLDHDNPLQLLVATILSAQCTDARVNIVTKKLFKKYLTPEDFLKVPAEELEQDIFSTGFYKAKSKNIRAACKRIIEDYNGKVPDNMNELLKLPGVGRKTANVVLGHAFDTPGIVVDTHVKRISNKLGFTDTDDPVKIEFKLMKIVPEHKWVKFTHYLINHGRNTCVARKPKCTECIIANECPSEKIL
jgi:endonuclease-3